MTGLMSVILSISIIHLLLDAQAVDKDVYLFKQMLPLWMHYAWFDEFRVIHSFDETSFGNESAKKQRHLIILPIAMQLQIS